MSRANHQDMLSRTVAIVEYRTTWTAEFLAITSELRDTLGREALQVDHIGSTAVLGLSAKDVIDVQVTVRSLDGTTCEVLLAAGFTTHAETRRQDHVPPGFQAREEDWAKLFFMQRRGARRCNIHVRQIGRPNQRYPLLVRDFLRAEGRIAQAYGEFKRRLASSLADPDTYPDVKDPVADIIYFAAENWALATNWKLGHEASPIEA